MSSNDDRIFRQLITSLGSIERELAMVRSVLERRVRRPDRVRQQQQQLGRQVGRRRVRREQEREPVALAPVILPPTPPRARSPVRRIATEDPVQAILEQTFHEAYEQSNRTLARVRVPKLKTKAVKVAELSRPLEDNCAICQDSHNKCDSIETSCGHHFGQECFMQWVRTKLSKRQQVSCPLCMLTGVKYHGFRPRKPPTRRDQPVVEPVA